jgi:probable rRNA maturation factor
MPSAPELVLSLQQALPTTACPVPRARLRRWILAALSARAHSARLTLRFVGNAESRTLNRDYRGKDRPTNVLTFPYGEDPLEADIVLCMPVLRAEARAQRKPLEHHLAHLVIHGVLHAQGFEHEDEDEAVVMESLETALLRRFRIPDPYRPAG